MKWLDAIRARLCRKSGKPGDTREEEIAAAIGLALDMYMDESVHDQESYVITIKRK